jgi:hypothetical protein
VVVDSWLFGAMLWISVTVFFQHFVPYKLRPRFSRIGELISLRFKRHDQIGVPLFLIKNIYF